MREMTPGSGSPTSTEDQVDVAVREFLHQYPPRPYRHRQSGDYPPHELEPVHPADGLRHLNEVPTAVARGNPRLTNDDDGENCHLWVIDERGRLCISQNPIPRLGDSNLHHTNLTGGGEASIGGEIWFNELPRVYLSGSSGRYPPEHAEHLEDAEQLFAAAGFDVQPLGWDQEIGKPQRVWLG